MHSMRLLCLLHLQIVPDMQNKFRGTSETAVKGLGKGYTRCTILFSRLSSSFEFIWGEGPGKRMKDSGSSMTAGFTLHRR